jgi:hypothetical protein
LYKFPPIFNPFSYDEFISFGAGNERTLFDLFNKQFGLLGILRVGEASLAQVSFIDLGDLSLYFDIFILTNGSWILLNDGLCS